MKGRASSVASRLLAIAVVLMLGCGREGSSTPGQGGAKVALLNVSYDPTREFYQDFNAAFAEHWRQETGQVVTIQQSHAGSGKQARAVMDGLEADVVTLALAYDIDIIARNARLLPTDWQQQLPHNSAPYRSTIVFLVRKGNPKRIADWDDLVRGDVSIITPNPKTSGGARWNYLAAWGYVLQRELGDLARLDDPSSAADVAAARAQARTFVTSLFQRVAKLDTGARGSTNTFLQMQMGDVLLAWENEAFLALKDLARDDVEIVVPSWSILAEPPVAVVEQVTARHGTTDIAREYLKYLYSVRGQQLAARHFYRPVEPASVPAELMAQFRELKLFTIEQAFGSWMAAQAEHFDDGGVFDQIYQPGR